MTAFRFGEAVIFIMIIFYPFIFINLPSTFTSKPQSSERRLRGSIGTLSNLKKYLFTVYNSIFLALSEIHLVISVNKI